jgi:hypothetical protein
VDPRKAPSTWGVNPRVKEELVKYGTPQAFKPRLGAVLAFWYEAAEHGLPPGISHEEMISVRRGEQKSDWRLYLITKCGFRIGIAERLDGEDLLLLLLLPAKSITVADALLEARKRL